MRYIIPQNDLLLPSNKRSICFCNQLLLLITVLHACILLIVKSNHVRIIVSETSIALPDSFRLGKHTDIHRTVWPVKLTDHLETSITGLSQEVRSRGQLEREMPTDHYRHVGTHTRTRERSGYP